MRLYTVVFTAVSIAAVQDLFYLKPAADKPIRLHSVYLANVGGTADAADAQEEDLRVEIIHVPTTVTVGSGGSAPTPNPLLPSDAAAGFTGRVNDTTVATTNGTLLTKHSDGWNTRVPFNYRPTPEERIVCANAAAIVVRLNLAPNDAFNVSGTAYVEELV